VLKLEIEDADDLTLDNLAYAVLNVPRRAKVLFVSPGNEFMELALGTEETQKVAEVSFAEPGIVADKAFQKSAATGAYDLVIFDQCAPQTAQQMPLANTLFIGRVPPVEGWAAGEVQNIPQIIDVDRVHPLMQFVEMGNVEIVECTPLQVPKGGTVLIDSDLGTLLAVAPREGFEDAVLGFEILGDGEFNTLWPRRPSFPLFIQNVLVYLGGVQSQRGAASIQPGQLMQIRGDAPTDQLQITAPDGKTTSVSRSGQNAFVFGDTDEIGIYEVREGKQNKVSQRFAANLFDGIESNIRPLPEIRTEYEEIKGQVAVERTRREAWKALLLVALVVLIVEWYVYNRRVYL
jgi:hypothetical protein